MELPPPLARDAVADRGLDVERPLLVQVSRFDPWKDPLGVIEVYRRVLGRRHVQEHFLMPRLIRDELAVVARLLEGDGTPARRDSCD
jgi:hypothetical protein